MQKAKGQDSSDISPEDAKLRPGETIPDLMERLGGLADSLAPVDRLIHLIVP